MMPEIGYFSLVLALCFAFMQAIFPMVGAQTGKTALMKSASGLALAQFLSVFIAFACLTYSFIQNDFSLSYVAANSSSLLPTIYRVCAVWGGHEGSMLLWLFLLSAWIVALIPFYKTAQLPFIARSFSILGMISVGFLIFLLWTSNPFERILLFLPSEGRDLNPLLQDPGLVSHPPLLYAGYVGFAVPFAFALASLMGRRLERAWATYARPFTLLSWSFLTVGIVLGSWWAYRQLGWGGWWFWDPVENASFMPWLAGVILIHSLIVIEKRGVFNAWGILIAIVAFALSLLGTFIVRSGVLISVHSFAVDPKRGFFILLFLLLSVGGALVMYAWHGRKLMAGDHDGFRNSAAGASLERGPFAFFSKETFLLLNNVGLFAALITVLLGTLYPLVIQVLGLGKLSVGAPYFDKTFGFLMLPILFLMGIAPLVHWKEGGWDRIKWRLVIMLAVSLIAGFFLPYLMLGDVSFLVFISVSLFVWIGLSLFQIPYKKTRFLGILFSHGGVAICFLGIILSTVYKQTKDVRMAPGDVFEMAGYRFELRNVHRLEGVNYGGEEANIHVYKTSGQFLGLLQPQIRIFTIQKMALPKAAIKANPLRDIYVTLSEPVGENAWGFRFSYKPFVRWIWVGGLLIALGGGISGWKQSRLRTISNSK